MSEDITKFPSTFQMARNIARQAWESGKGMVQGKGLFCSAEKAFARLQFCEKCKYYKDERCLQCGCFMHSKVHLELTTCPAGKWTEDLIASDEALEQKAEYIKTQSEQGSRQYPAVDPTLSMTTQEKMEFAGILSASVKAGASGFSYKNKNYNLKKGEQGRIYIEPEQNPA
jgi:hypothetical protein